MSITFWRHYKRSDNLYCVQSFLCFEMFGRLRSIEFYFQFVQPDDDQRGQLWDACSSSPTHSWAGLSLLTLSPAEHDARLSCSVPCQSPEPGLGPGQPTLPFSLPLPSPTAGQPGQSHRCLPEQCARPTGGHQTE